MSICLQGSWVFHDLLLPAIKQFSFSLTFQERLRVGLLPPRHDTVTTVKNIPIRVHSTASIDTFFVNYFVIESFIDLGSLSISSPSVFHNNSSVIIFIFYLTRVMQNIFTSTDSCLYSTFLIYRVQKLSSGDFYSA
jgi:hypothetical protein